MRVRPIMKVTQREGGQRALRTATGIVSVTAG
jgi:hypothetical protein